MKNRFSVILLLVILVCFISLPLLAKEYDIANYDIKMNLTEEGNYLVTERITYNFKEGSFTQGYREISAEGFKGLKFISIQGADREVSDYQVKGNGDKIISWTFPPTTGQATFVLKYRALGALKSRGSRNVIDWNPVGSDWQVSIRGLDIEINLPQSVAGLQIEPKDDLVSNLDNRKISFHYSKLPARTYYHLILSFDEIIPMDGNDRFGQLSWAVIIGLILGVILAAYDIYSGIKNRPEPVPSPFKPESLSFLKLGGIYHSDNNRKKRGLTAEVFSLAMAGKIKLISKPRKGFLKTKKVDVQIKIISEDGLEEEEKLIIDGLRKEENLKKFSRDYRFFGKVLKTVEIYLKEKGLISENNLAIKRKIYFTALLIFIPGLAALIYGLITGWSTGVGIGFTLSIWAVGRLIRGALYPALSKEGMGLRNDTARLLDEKKESLDGLIRKSPERALEFFFEQLPYIILHRSFSAAAFNKYKKVFKEAEEFNLPDWLEFDLSELDMTLDALEVVEVIDYVLVSTIFIAANTGAAAAGAAGAGAPGSGAGGGGGGAA